MISTTEGLGHGPVDQCMANHTLVKAVEDWGWVQNQITHSHFDTRTRVEKLIRQPPIGIIGLRLGESPTTGQAAEIQVSKNSGI